MPAAKTPETRDVYRTAKPGIVIRRYGNRDETPLPKGTNIDPGTVDEQADLDRLVSLGLIEKIAVPAKAQPAKLSKRVDVEPPPVVLPGSGSRIIYTAAIHHLVIKRIGTTDETPFARGAVLPADVDQNDLRRLVVGGLVTPTTVSY